MVRVPSIHPDWLHALGYWRVEHAHQPSKSSFCYGRWNAGTPSNLLVRKHYPPTLHCRQQHWTVAKRHAKSKLTTKQSSLLMRLESWRPSIKNEWWRAEVLRRHQICWTASDLFSPSSSTTTTTKATITTTLLYIDASLRRGRHRLPQNTVLIGLWTQVMFGGSMFTIFYTICTIFTA